MEGKFLKVFAVVGSPNMHGNTEMMTAHSLKAIADEGIETELFPLAGKEIKPCNNCNACSENGGECIIQDDFSEVFNKMVEADGLIFSSPVYVGSCTALLKAVMERSCMLNIHKGGPFKLKVGGPLVVGRRSGHNFTIAEINFWFHLMGMIVPGSSYWNIAYGWQSGEVSKDEEGLRTAWDFGKNMAFVMKKMA
jgi:multimeric flavodoxin WrbA